MLEGGQYGFCLSLIALAIGALTSSIRVSVCIFFDSLWGGCMSGRVSSKVLSDVELVACMGGCKQIFWIGFAGAVVCREPFEDRFFGFVLGPQHVSSM